MALIHEGTVDHNNHLSEIEIMFHPARIDIDSGH